MQHSKQAPPPSKSAAKFVVATAQVVVSSPSSRLVESKRICETLQEANGVGAVPGFFPVEISTVFA